jgi:hypothetical protein
MHRSWLVVGGMVGLGALALSAGCKKDDSADTSKPAPAPIAMSQADPAAKAVDFEVAADGKTSIDMPAPKERIKGETTAAKGQLHIDVANLGATRGDIFVDLTTFSTHTFGDAEKDATQTKHARTWLQVDDMEKDPATRERNRWVHFAIRSVDGLSATDLSKVAPVAEGGDDIRTVTLTAHGELEIHALPAKAPKDAPLQVRVHVPTGSPAGTKPTLIEVKGTAPFQIVLADHDIKPRDLEGQLAQKSFDLLGTKVADVANVTVNLTAKPSH